MSRDAPKVHAPFLKIEPRREVSRGLLYATPLLAVALTVLAGFFIFLAMGYDPFLSLYHFFISPLLTVYGLSELMVKAAPLIMIGVGLAIGFRANVWNIGAEGQLTMGAVAGGCVALAFWGEETALTLPLMCLAGIAGGLAYAAIPAFLKTRFGVNEILTSLMLTYVATLFLSTLVYGPLKDPLGFNFPQSRMFGDAALLPILAGGTRLHLGTVIALAVAVAAPDDPVALVTAAEYAARAQLAPAAVAERAVDPSSALARAELFARRLAIAGLGAPGSTEWAILQAEALAAAGQLSEAANVAGAALAAEPTSTRAAELCRRIYRRGGDRAGFARATLSLARTLPHGGDRLALLREAAAVLDGELGEVETAMWVYRRILAEEPSAPEYERALEIGREADDVRAQVEILSARLAWLSRLAAVDGQAALSQVPLLLARAALRREVGDVAGAERDLEILLALDPGHLQALDTRAELARDHGQAATAVELWRRYLERQPEPGPHLRVAQALATLLATELGDVGAAIYQLEQAVKLDPRAAEAREQLIDLLAQAGEWPRAVRELGELAAHTDDNAARAAVQLRAARILREQLGDSRGAKATLETALALDPGNLDVISYLAEHTGSDDAVYRQALRDLRAAIARDPTQADLHRSLAAVSDRHGDPDGGFFGRCVAAVLDGGADHIDSAELETAGAAIGARVEAAATGSSAAALDAESFSKHLSALSSEGEYLADDLWRLIGDAYGKLRQREPGALGFGRGERVKHPDRVFPVAAYQARVLVEREVDFYVSSAQRGFAQALGVERPALCLSEDVARADSPHARFLLGCALAHARLGTGALTRAGDGDAALLDLSDDELGSLFLAAARAAGGEAPAELADLSPDDALEAGLHKQLGRRDRRQLGAMAARTAELTPLAWWRAVARTSARAGLLLAGDVRDLGRWLGAAESGSWSAEQGDALAWVVGSDHLWLRRHVGFERR